MTDTTTTKKTRKTFAEIVKKYSPVKKGVVLNEDDDYQKYNKILPKIWVGNYDAAKSKDFFLKNKIKAVVNCSKDIPNFFCDPKIIGKEVEYLRIPVDDSLKEVDYKKMLDHIPVAMEFIDKHTHLHNSSILIHCAQGRQRSCCIMACYLMKTFNLTPEKAIKFVVSRRPEAFFFNKSINFEWTMDQYHKQLQTAKKKR